jgi:hypothetical protein
MPTKPDRDGLAEINRGASAGLAEFAAKPRRHPESVRPRRVRSETLDPTAVWPEAFDPTVRDQHRLGLRPATAADVLFHLADRRDLVLAAAAATSGRLDRSVLITLRAGHYAVRIQRLKERQRKLRELLEIGRRRGDLDAEAVAEGEALLHEADRKITEHRTLRVTPGVKVAETLCLQPVRAASPVRRDRRLSCPRPRARARVRSSSRGGDSGDDSGPSDAPGPGSGRPLDVLGARRVGRWGR